MPFLGGRTQTPACSLCEHVLVFALLMPQGQHTRFLSRNRHILRHCLASRKSPKRSAIAAWNLRRLGQGGFGETSWLKLRACTRLAVRRGWRSILISDCMADEPGSLLFSWSWWELVVAFQLSLWCFVRPRDGQHVATRR